MLKTNLREIYHITPEHYPLVLILSLCLFALCVSFQNGRLNTRIATQAKIELQTLTEAYAKLDTLTASLSDKISALDALLTEYAEENGRLEGENQGYKDYIDGFWELMEQEYDFEGHNELYNKTH